MIRRFKRLAERVRAAFKSFRYPGLGGQPTGAGSASGQDLYGFFRNLPGATFDYRREAGNLWENGVVLTLIKWVTRNYPEARQVVERPGADGKPEIVFDHPILDLLENPSIDFDRSVLEAGYLLSLLVDGNAYLVKVRSALGKVVRLHYVPHFMMTPYWPKDGSEFISGYVYRVDGQTFLLPNSEVIHLRDGLDPQNTRKGMSTFAGVLREICTDNEAATFAAALMRNCGVPSVVFSPKSVVVDPLTPEQIEQFQQRYAETSVGEGAGKPFVNGIPVDMNVPGFSPEQLVLDKMRSIPVDHICAALNLDPMVVALPSTSKTYSNYPEAKRGAYDSCLKPMQRNVDSQMTRQLMGDIIGDRLRPVSARDRLARDYSCVGALQEDQDKLHERCRKNFESGVWTRELSLTRMGEVADPARDNVYMTDLKLEQLQAQGEARAASGVG